MSEPSSLGTHSVGCARKSIGRRASARMPSTWKRRRRSGVDITTSAATRSGNRRASRSASRPPIEKPQIATGPPPTRRLQARRARPPPTPASRASRWPPDRASVPPCPASIGASTRAAAPAQRLGQRPDLERRAGDAVQAQHAARVAGDGQRRLVAAAGAESPRQAEHRSAKSTSSELRPSTTGSCASASGTPGTQSAQLTVAFWAVDGGRPDRPRRRRSGLPPQFPPAVSCQQGAVPPFAAHDGTVASMMLPRAVRGVADDRAVGFVRARLVATRPVMHGGCSDALIRSRCASATARSCPRRSAASGRCRRTAARTRSTRTPGSAKLPVGCAMHECAITGHGQDAAPHECPRCSAPSSSRCRASPGR